MESESDSNNVVISDNRQMDIKREIKEEPKETSAVESGYEQFETVFVASHFEECASTSQVDCDDVGNQMKIKDEPCWPESTSNEIKQEVELSPPADSDLKNEIKESASHTQVITGDVTAEGTSRLHTESLCGNTDNVSCFLADTNSAEISLGNNELNIRTSHVPSSSKPQMIEEPETLSVLDSNVNISALMQDCSLPYKCDVCERSFKSFLGLRKHSAVHRSEKTYTCEVCNETFIAEYIFKLHKQVHEVKRPHTCEVCGKTFPQPYRLKQHQLTHEGIKPYTCEICNKSFTQRSHLNQHKLTHEGKYPHTCEICNKGFINLYTFKHHQLSHDGIRPYKCDICSNTFFHAGDLNRHKLLHETDRPYKCDICSKGFVQAYDLNKHKLSHEDIRLFKCETCNKGFNYSGHLKRHKLIHENKRPYSCDICNKSFVQVAHLKRHKLTHDGK